LLKVPALSSIISGCTEKKRSALVSGIAALLARIKAWLKFENKQFSKIISVALYVKMGAAMRGVKIGQWGLGIFYCGYFFEAGIWALGGGAQTIGHGGSHTFAKYHFLRATS
jgi:hypothetical protein